MATIISDLIELSTNTADLEAVTEVEEVMEVAVTIRGQWEVTGRMSTTMMPSSIRNNTEEATEMVGVTKAHTTNPTTVICTSGEILGVALSNYMENTETVTEHTPKLLEQQQLKSYFLRSKCLKYFLNIFANNLV